MKPRTLAILALATLVFAIAAVVVNTGGPAFTQASGGNLLFPELNRKINDAAKIVIATNSGKFTVERKGNVWGIVEKYGYPAKFETVKSTLVGLARLRTLEAKTAEASLYPRIEVEDVGAKGAKSSEITVQNAKGEMLASLILGKRRYGRGGSDQNAELYVRKPGNPQSWLATGTLERKDDIKDWMQREIVKLERGRVREVTVTPANAASAQAGGHSAPNGSADDKRFAIKKDEPKDNDFALQGVPPEDKVKSAYDVNSIGGALEDLNADDVLPAKDLKPDATLLRTIEYKTFDGAVVDLKLYKQADKTWAAIAAAYDPTGATAQPTAPPSKADASQSKAEKSKGIGVAEAGKPKLKSADEVKKEVDGINARVKDWIYGLASYDLSTLEKKFADLVEPKDKAKPKS